MGKFSEVPSDISEWDNPISKLIAEHSEQIEILDMMATEYVEKLPESENAGKMLPSEALATMAMIDPAAIQKHSHNQFTIAKSKMKTIKSELYEELVYDQWTGNQSDEFQSYIEGSDGYRGLDVFLKEITDVSERQCLSFLNLSEDIKEKLTALRDIFVDVIGQIDRYAEENRQDNEATGIWGTLKNLATAGGLIGTFFRLKLTGMLSGLLYLTILILECFGWVGDHIAGSANFMDDFHGPLPMDAQVSSGISEVTW